MKLIHRRRFIHAAASTVAAALLPSSSRRAAAAAATTATTAAPSLRVQRLAWAGVRLQTAAATLYLDPLTNPAVWEAALSDRLVPVDADPQVSWVVSGGGRRILHGGDTLWHGAWWHIGRALGPFDAAFLPINGARFSWRQPAAEASAVLTPAQAVDAAAIVGARLLVPIHYGVAGAEGYRELPDPEGALREAARRRHVAIAVMRPGEWLTWPK